MTRLLIDPATDFDDPATVTLSATLLDPTPALVRTFEGITDASTVVDLPAPAPAEAWRLTVRRPRATTNRLGFTSTDPGPIVAERTVHFAGTTPIAWAALIDVDPATLRTTAVPGPAWDAAITALQAEIDALPTGGGGGGGFSGAYADLTGKPTIPASPADIGAEPVGTTDARIAALVDGAPDALNTLKELAAQLATDEGAVAGLAAAVAGKATLADITAAIQALSLGTAATRSATDFDPAGAAAAVTLGTLGGITPTAVDTKIAATQLALLTPRRLQGQRIARQLTAFQAGHPFTVFLANGGTWNLNDTSDAALGTQCVSVTTGTGGTRSEIRSATLPAFDMTTNSLKVWVKADPATFTSLAKLTLFVGETASNGYTVDLWARSAGQTLADMTAGWVAFTADLAFPFTYGTPTTRTAMTVVGLSATATNGAAAKVYFGGMALVAKTIPPLITFGFDDGYATQYTAAKAKLDQYGYPATAYVIQDLIGTGGGTYLSLAQCHALEDQSGWEIAAHSATVADHTIIGGFTALTDSQLRTNMETNKRWLIGNGFRGADHTAYPQGLYNDAVTATARDYFTTARTVYTAGALELPRPTYAHRMRCVEVDAGVPVATLTAHVDRVKQNGGWLQFYLHQVSGSATGASTDPTTFGALVDYIAGQGVAVRTVGEVIALAQSSADEIPAFLGAVT